MTNKSNLEILEMSITPDYVPHWDIASALREFLQNALDAQTQGFKMELLEDENETHIINYGTNLPLKTLLLGMTTKDNSEDEIGQFGEGYKLACLVLTRNHVSVKISSPQGSIEPFIGYSKNYETDILSFYLNKEEIHLPGVKISFSKDDIPITWLKSFILEEEPQKPRILRNQPGRVYSAGLHLSLDLGTAGNLEEGYHWGYNLSPKDLKLDRDRRMVSSSSLKEALINILKRDATIEEIYEAIGTPFPEFKDTSSWSFESEIGVALTRVFREKHGDKAYAIKEDSEEADRIIKKTGFSPIVIHSTCLFNLINNNQLNTTKLVQLADLKADERENYSLNFEEQKNFDEVMKLLISCEDKLAYEQIFYQIQKIQINPVLFLDPSMRGIYDRKSNSIFISGKVYKNKGELTVLILHELVHTVILGHEKDFQDAFDNLVIKVLNYSIFRNS